MTETILSDSNFFIAIFEVTLLIAICHKSDISNFIFIVTINLNNIRNEQLSFNYCRHSYKCYIHCFRILQAVSKLVSRSTLLERRASSSGCLANKGAQQRLHCISIYIFLFQVFTTFVLSVKSIGSVRSSSSNDLKSYEIRSLTYFTCQ